MPLRAAEIEVRDEPGSRRRISNYHATATTFSN